MKKQNRIKKNEEFQAVFKHGKSFANRQLVLYYLQKENQHHFRIGLSVNKRIGNAVMRNQVKRYLRQAFHELEPSVDPSYDLVIIARKPTNQMDYFQLKNSLTHLLKKTNLLAKSNNS
ncbi:ribonuclease P protein component [Pontibacillus litoralis]|uniref:Ribonuclease P protein component n=1 Tax=Pontibacillus litoralis JSM 072002 TaxID=1385512 RepID=A0A0A5G3M2_9BACI|nr:ribonuclease P protein component [Pontibacillus litoralis]KGX85680.1 ribonuclease P [Pontibacillus litoralis JSM 072002]